MTSSRIARSAQGTGRPAPNATLTSFLATWRSGYAAACKAVYTGSIPVVALSGLRGPISAGAAKAAPLPRGAS